MVVTWPKSLLLNIVLLFAATLGDEIEPSEYRWHGIIRPLTYDITITLLPQKDAFTGKSEMYIQIKRPTQYIAMHAYKLEVKFISLFSYPHQVVHANIGSEYNYDAQIIAFKFEKELIPGPYSINLEFEGQISNETNGFFKIMYTDTEGNQQWVLATHLKPTGARRLFPCWDEPASKATFGLNIKHPKDYVALSNMPVRKREDEEYNVLTGFHASPVMSPHLVALVVGKLVTISTSINNVNIYTLFGENRTDQHEILISGLFKADILTKTAQEYTQNVANTSLMLRKIDHVILPYLPDNVAETWGISLYRKDNVVSDPISHILQDQAEVNALVASKVAYQWISSIVGPYWWTEMWLSEALTMFLAQKILILSLKDYLQFYYAYDLQYRNYRTSIYNITEKENEVNTVEEINRINHRSSNFVKGCALLLMLENIMTADVFQEGIMRYLHQFRFNLATVEEFWDALQYALDESSIPHKDFSVKELMNNWLRQKYYPILNVIRDGDTIIITQESANSEKYGNNKWRIPIILDIRTKNGSQIRTTNIYWLNPNETNILINDVRKNESFIIYNIGNYRVSYNQVSWLQLLSILSSSTYAQVHEVQRAQIIDDAFYFLMKGKLEFQMFLDFTQYLQYERHYVPWLAVTNILSEYSRYFQISESDILKTHLSEIFNKTLEDVGYEEQPDDDENKILVRLLTTKLLCDLGNTVCRTTATNKLKDFIEDPEKLTTKQLQQWKNWIFCTGLMLADIDIWRKVLIRYRETQDQELLIYLTCTEQPNLIISYMNSLYGIPRSSEDLFDLSTIIPSPPKLSDKECEMIYVSISKRYANNTLVIEYIIKYFDLIRPKSMSWGTALIAIINNVYSQEILNKLSALIEINRSEKPVREAKTAISNQMSAIKEMLTFISRLKRNVQSTETTESTKPI